MIDEKIKPKFTESIGLFLNILLEYISDITGYCGNKKLQTIASTNLIYSLLIVQISMPEKNFSS